MAARRVMWHNNCARAVAICPVSEAQRRRGARGQEAPLLDVKQPGLQHIPCSQTAPGDRRLAVSEACLCDGTFAQVWSTYSS